ncbi:MAG: sigma-E factor regulatory protein RseB domain-containing protein [Fimbriimonas sp.]
MSRLYGFAAIGMLLPLALSQVTAEQADTTPPVLKRALLAGPKLRYVGTRVIEFRRQGQPVRYTEIVTRDGPNTRIEFPSGSMYEGQIIVETSKERRHFFPDKNEIRVMAPRREEALHRLARLANSGGKFVISAAEGSGIAGVRTSQVVVKDQAGNVVQRLYIEPRSGLLVKRQMFDPVGTQMGLYEFTRLKMNPKIDPLLFRLERKGAKVIYPIDTLREVAASKGFRPAFLRTTSGYALHFSRMVQPDGNDVLMEFYGSPKGRVSLYQTKAGLDPEKLAKFGRGQVNVYTWKQNGYTLALVGNQDRETLRKLAASIAFGT